MGTYIPCVGSGKNAVDIERYPSQQDGLGFTRGKTFGKCSACSRTVMVYGLAMFIKVNRHKAQSGDSDV